VDERSSNRSDSKARASIEAPAGPGWRWLAGSGRSALVQFALCGIVATIAIGVLAVAVSREIGTEQAIHDAKQSTRLVAEGFVAPNIDDAVLAGDADALRDFDAVVRKDVLRDGIVRVKVWSPDSRIVYSDEPRLIGRRFDLDASERAALRGGAVVAEMTDFGPENRFEPRRGKLLEVYVPIRTSAGRPLTVEAYQRFSSVAASGRRLWLAFAPALLGGLLLLLMITLPLAWALARRVRLGRQQHEALLLKALNASQTERRTIAADLHDSVVQGLAGAAYSLEAEAARFDRRADAEAGEALHRSADVVRENVRALRALLVDIYPPNLHRCGLAAALGDLAKVSTSRGLPTSADVPATLVLDEATEHLLFRCAQEALRNIHKHARATSAAITIRHDDDRVLMDVLDDGVGFDPAVIERRREEGHFGLNVVRDLVTDAGGDVRFASAPGAGTRVRVELPIRSPVPVR
jgi:two-component system, NarL family, sensor kinase